MLADAEYSLNFPLRLSLQSPSVRQVKSSLNTRYHWSRMSTVQSEPANRSPPPPPPSKQRSLFLTEVNSSIHTGHHGKVENSSNMLFFLNHRLSLLYTQLSARLCCHSSLRILCLSTASYFSPLSLSKA